MQKTTYKNISGVVLPLRKDMTVQDEDIERQKVAQQIHNMKHDPSKRVSKPLFCTPNCQHQACGKNGHVFQNDYNKSVKNPRAERPGIPFLFEGLEKAPKNYNTLNPDYADPAKGLGAKQTPIDLKTDIKIHTDFSDVEFNFNYEMVNAQETLKFNEQGDAFFYQLNANQPNEAKKESYLETNTISLFDKHISKAKLYGLQYHFHSPSEHSVNGKLLDLEMHIVHQMQASLTKGNMPASFSHGVLGFLFKVVPESFFTTVKVDAPELDMEYHDQFLSNLALSETENIKLGKTRSNDLDLTKFVDLLEFNRRWTYSGSLTTIPCSEGILWNVIEQIIPIRQSTMDKYNYFRKIEAHQYTNKGECQDEWLNEAKAATYPINGNSVVQDGDKFMRIAVCNRKVVNVNDRPVYHIDKPKQSLEVMNAQVVSTAEQEKYWKVILLMLKHQDSMSFKFQIGNDYEALNQIKQIYAQSNNAAQIVQQLQYVNTNGVAAHTHGKFVPVEYGTPSAFRENVTQSGTASADREQQYDLAKSPFALGE